MTFWFSVLSITVGEFLQLFSDSLDATRSTSTTHFVGAAFSSIFCLLILVNTFRRLELRISFTLRVKNSFHFSSSCSSSVRKTSTNRGSLINKTELMRGKRNERKNRFALANKPINCLIKTSMRNNYKFINQRKKTHSRRI